MPGKKLCKKQNKINSGGLIYQLEIKNWLLRAVGL